MLTLKNSIILSKLLYLKPLCTSKESTIIIRQKSLIIVPLLRLIWKNSKTSRVDLLL